MTTPIVLILDNARYQKAYEVQEYAKMKNIQLEYLPAYSPNLNLIERFWKFTKKVLVINQYYETYTEFQTAFKNFFTLLEQPNHQHMNSLKTLLTMNFEIITNY
jgi:transposase